MENEKKRNSRNRKTRLKELMSLRIGSFKLTNPAYNPIEKSSSFKKIAEKPSNMDVIEKIKEEVHSPKKKQKPSKFTITMYKLGSNPSTITKKRKKVIKKCRAKKSDKLDKHCKNISNHHFKMPAFSTKHVMMTPQNRLVGK